MRPASARLLATAIFAVGLPVVSVQAAHYESSWSGGDAGFWNATGNWISSPTGGGVPNKAGVNTYDVVIAGAPEQDVAVTLDLDAFINDLTVGEGDLLQIGHSWRLGIDGGDVANSGSIAFLQGVGAANTDLQIRASTLLSGGGAISLSHYLYHRISASSGAYRLTNQDNTIRGAGQIGLNQMLLTNRGVIDANIDAAILNVDVTDDVADGLINAGTLGASHGGVLHLARGNYTNYEGATHGTIQALAGSVVEIDALARVTGGLLTTTGNGVIRSIGNSARLTDLAIAGNFEVAHAAVLEVQTAIRNTGHIRLQHVLGSAEYTDLRLVSALTLSGGGALTLTDDAYTRVYGSSGAWRLTNQDNTIQGRGLLGNNKLLLTNRGVIDANVAGFALTVDPTDGQADGARNEGVMRASNGGVLLLLPGAHTNAGLLEAAGGNVTFTTSAGLTNFASGTLTGGTWKVWAGSTLTLPGALIQTNAADVTLAGADSTFAALEALTANTAPGAFHVLNGRQFATPGALANAGLVEIGAGSTLTVPGGFTQTAGRLIGGGTLDGAATILGGTVEPGDSPGTLTVTGPTVLGPASELLIDLASEASFDQLRGLASVVIDGATLRVRLLGDYVPPLGAQFTIVAAGGGRSGKFAVEDLPLDPTNNEPRVRVYYLADSVVLSTVEVVPEPASLALLALGGVLLMPRRK